jgi:hypothetical protein
LGEDGKGKDYLGLKYINKQLAKKYCTVLPYNTVRTVRTYFPSNALFRSRKRERNRETSKKREKERNTKMRMRMRNKKINECRE